MQIIKVVSRILLIAVLFNTLSCKKDKDDDTQPTTQPTTQASIVGTWQLTDVDYMSTITFIDEHMGVEYFFDGEQNGTADFMCTLHDKQLTLTYDGVQLGDYADYNGISFGGSLSAEVDITENELTFIYEGESYVYTRVTDEDIIDDNDLVGNWQYSEGDFRGVLNFRLTEERFHTATECFVASSDSGAADFSWDINGNMFMASYFYGKLYGAYGAYNEVEHDHLTIGQVSTSENQLTFTVGGESYVYTRMTDANLVNRSDLRGTYWKTTDGTYTSVISFNNNDDVSFYKGMDSFIDGTIAGSAKDFAWTVSGDLFTIEYQGFYGDYASYNEVSLFCSKTLPVSYANNQLTFETPDGDITYTPLPAAEVIVSFDLVGTWEITDDSYNGTLTFNEDESGTDEFTDGEQSGSATTTWFINGNILTIEYATMTGDYASYNGVSPHVSTIAFASISGSQLTINYEGVDYIYTKTSK